MIDAWEAAVTYEEWQLDALGNAEHVADDPICFSWWSRSTRASPASPARYQELKSTATT